MYMDAQARNPLPLLRYIKLILWSATFFLKFWHVVSGSFNVEHFFRSMAFMVKKKGIKFSWLHVLTFVPLLSPSSWAFQDTYPWPRTKEARTGLFDNTKQVISPLFASLFSSEKGETVVLAYPWGYCENEQATGCRKLQDPELAVAR